MIRCWQESAKRQKLESPSDSNCSGSVDGKLACMGEPVEDKAARNVVQQEVAKVVVRVLSPYYANKQIATKVCMLICITVIGHAHKQKTHTYAHKHLSTNTHARTHTCTRAHTHTHTPHTGSLMYIFCTTCTVGSLQGISTQNNTSIVGA